MNALKVALNNKLLRIGLGIVWAGIFVFFLLRHINLDSIEETFSDINYIWLLVSLFFAFLYMVARAIRFRLLLGRGSFRQVLSVTAASWGAGLIYPGVGGDATFAWLATRDIDVPLPRSTGAAVLARIFDVASLLIVVLLLGPFVAISVPHGVRLFSFVLVLALIAVLYVLFNSKTRSYLVELMAKKVSHIGKLGYYLQRTEAVLAELSVAQNLVALFITTVAARFFSAVMYYYIGVAFSAGLSLPAIWFALAIRSILYLFPIQGIVGAGTSQFWWILAFGMIGVGFSQAVVMALAISVLDLVVTLPLAGVGYFDLLIQRHIEKIKLLPKQLWGLILLAVREIKASWQLGIALALFFILRFPSLFEPHWYTDEAGYANTAWLTMHGYTLYQQVWNNKPPLLFLTYEFALKVFGPSEFGIHILSFFTEALAVGAVYAIVRYLSSERRAIAAGITAAVCFGIPLFNGDLSLPENFIIGFVSIAFLIVLRAFNKDRFSIPKIAFSGVLVAIAILYQQTALAEFGAILVWLLASPAKNKFKAALVYLLSVGLPIVVVMAPYVAAAGFRNVWYALVTSYIGYTQYSLAPTYASIAPRVIEIVLFAQAVLLAAFWWTKRQLIWLWATATLIVANLPNRNYPHFILETLPALIVAVAIVQLSFKLPRLRLLYTGSFARYLCAASAMSAVVLGSYVFPSGHMANLTADYYPIFAGYVTGAVSAHVYDDTFDWRTWSEAQVVKWIKKSRLENVSAVVWSADSWVYLLAHLKMVVTSPAIYVDAGELYTPQQVVASFSDNPPILVITTPDAVSLYPSIKQFLQHDYTQVYKVGIATVYLWEGSVVSLDNAIPVSKRIMLQHATQKVLGEVSYGK